MLAWEHCRCTRVNTDNVLFPSGGILKHIGAVTALCSPTVNCYRRLHAPWVPDLANWGIDDRESSFRIKNYSHKVLHVWRDSEQASNVFVIFSLGKGLNNVSCNYINLIDFTDRCNSGPIVNCTYELQVFSRQDDKMGSQTISHGDQFPQKSNSRSRLRIVGPFVFFASYPGISLWLTGDFDWESHPKWALEPLSCNCCYCCCWNRWNKEQDRATSDASTRSVSNIK